MMAQGNDSGQQSRALSGQVVDLQSKGWKSGRELDVTVLRLNEIQERGCSSDEHDDSVK